MNKIRNSKFKITRGFTNKFIRAIRMNSRISVAILIFIFLFFNFAPLAQAADGLVPCEGTECTFCHLLVLIQKIIDYMIYLVFPLSAVMIVIGGGYILTAGGSESRVSKGKEIITAAIVGLLIALMSWLIIDTIIRSISSTSFKDDWYKIGEQIGC